MSSEELKPYACTACVQRKVKCDKRLPCLACSRSRLQCHYRATPPPQRRKRKLDSSSQTLLEKLRSHESLLRNAGLPFEAFDDSNDGEDDHDVGGAEVTENLPARPLPVVTAPVASSSTEMQAPRRGRGLLVPEHGGKRYYDHGLMAVLGQEYKQNPINSVNQHDLESLQGPGADDLPQEAPDILASIGFASPSTQASPLYEHPPGAAIMKYWSIFVENVHPLTKILHRPTMHRIMVDSSSISSKNSDALRFSIYACAVASLTDKECQGFFGQSQASLLYAFQSTTRYMLLESSFLRAPDIDLLRAHMLLLTSMLHTSDTSSLWILMGSAIRIAQSQGLHRDGAALGLPPFDIEMRRRLWWYLVTLDVRLSELVGLETALPKSTDTLLPSNVNDVDLEPDMTTPPKERIGASEMSFCLLQCHVAQFLRDQNVKPDDCELPQSNRLGKQGEKRSVSQFESFLEEEILRFCDPVIGVQFLTTTIARSTICKLRLMAHHRGTRPNPDQGRTTTSTQGNEALNIAKRTIEYDNLIHSSKSLRGFLWHVRFYFPWGAPVILLKCLTARVEWDEGMEEAWEQIGELHEHHPEYRDSDKVMHLIVSGLTLKAWATREAALKSRGMLRQRVPDFIIALQTRQASTLARHSDFGTGITRIVNEELSSMDVNSYDHIATSGYDFSNSIFEGVDWSNWLA